MWYSTILSAFILTVLCSTKAQRNYNASENPYGCVCIPQSQCQQDYGINRKFMTCETPGNICCVPPHSTNEDKRSFKRHSTDGEGCGRRHVYTGHVDPTDGLAEIAEFPWMVSIQKRIKLDRQGGVGLIPVCGGSLIHPRAVLTAAHCFNNLTVSEVVISAGEWNLDRTTEPLRHQVKDVREIIIHENFNRADLYNDVAILILSTAFDLLPHIHVVCLPDVNDVIRPSCVATGWGRDSSNLEYRGERILKKIELPPFDWNVCEYLYRWNDHNYILGESQICFGGERGKDTCKGDSGGPLVCRFANDRTRYVQMGIVSWGTPMCGSPGFPGIYTSTTHFLSWIDEKMVLHNLDNTIYRYRP